jgi:formimidoylglutamate deiminase
LSELSQSPRHTDLFAPHALLREGWRRNVRIAVEDGIIRAVAADTEGADATGLPGIVVPGIANLHSHAFQRGMAGLAEYGGGAADHFWSWREVMYLFLARLSPEMVEAITALAFMEMLEAGFTAVGEFHYLHKDPAGRAYADSAELAGRVIAAASATGIGLTLLPVFYAHSDFGGKPPTEGQRRFVTGLEEFARLFERCRSMIASLPAARIGLAPHSLRAVTPQELAELCTLAPEGPIHIHAAEQVREVEACLAATGMRPVEWLLRHAGVDSRWCLVHCTHMTAAEIGSLARNGAVAGLCPVTEANLGDGIFAATEFLAVGGRFGLGTDSNVRISVSEEIRSLEYSQRLRDRARNRLAQAQGQSTGRRLFEAAGAGGAQALQRPEASIAPGSAADFLVLDSEHPALIGRAGDRWIDSWIFAAANEPVREVWVGGRRLVEAGRHVARAAIVARYGRAIRALLGG